MKNTLTKKSSQSPVFPTSFREPVPFGFFSLSSSLSLSKSSFFWHIPRQKCSGSSARQHAVSNASRKNAPKSTSFVVTKEKTVRYGFRIQNVHEATQSHRGARRAFIRHRHRENTALIKNDCDSAYSAIPA